MGQKMDPHGLRVGVIKDWSSKWYADSKNFGDYLVEDNKIRKYVKKKLYVSGISKIEIERTAKFVKVNVFTAKPGLVIGKGGNLSEALKAELEFEYDGERVPYSRTNKSPYVTIKNAEHNKNCPCPFSYFCAFRSFIFSSAIFSRISIARSKSS